MYKLNRTTVGNQDIIAFDNLLPHITVSVKFAVYTLFQQICGFLTDDSSLSNDSGPLNITQHSQSTPQRQVFTALFPSCSAITIL